MMKKTRKPFFYKMLALITMALSVAAYAKQTSDTDAVLRKFANQNKLVFFYKSTCPYCQQFAPVIKDFSQRYNITVTPITLDDTSLPEFPNSQNDSGQAEKFHITAEPELFVVNSATNKVTLVSDGFIDAEDLRSRILNIANNPQNDD